MENLLSDVARVKVQLQNPVLPFKRKAELRREAVKAYIRSKPYGKRITSTEIKSVANFKTPSNAYLFMERLVKRGIIVKHNIGPRSFFYTVPGDVRTTTPATIKPEPTPADVADQNDGRYPQTGPRQPRKAYRTDQLKALAMAYCYHYDGDVKGFIKWLESQEEL